MKVYHGSSTLSEGTIPIASYTNGVFLTPQKELAQIFGRTIHVFELSEDLILDLRNEKHLERAKKHKLFKKLELHEIGLPLAFNHVTSIESLITAKEIALSLGFNGCFFFETSSAIGIELWDSSQLTYLKSEENLRFDELNK